MRDHRAGRQRGRYALGIPLLAACLTIACGSAQERAQLHLERGDGHLARGAHAAAALEYHRALDADPNLADAHYGLAQALSALGKRDGETWELRETIRLDADNLDARLRLGRLALTTGETAEALEQAQALLARDAEHLEGRLLKTAALLAAGDLEQAAAESEAVLRQHPDEKRALHHLAQVHTRHGRLADAERHLLRYRALDGGSLAASRELLRFYAATGQTAEAESFLREALLESADDERAELAVALADLLERGERASEAEATLRLALDAAPERLDVRTRLAQLLAAQGRLDQGRAVLEQARELGGAAPEHCQTLGDLLAAGELLEEALRAYREGIALAPDSVSLRLREADILRRQGDLAQSSARIRALLDEHPGDPAVELAHIRTLALEERSGEAIERLRELLARDPDNPRAHFLLGTLWMGRSRPTQALGSLEVAAEGLRGEEQRAARQLLARAHLQTGDLMSAVALAEQVLAEDPADLQARLVLADALLEGGAPRRAEAVLNAAGVSESAPLEAARARIFARTGRLVQAQAALERAMVLEPKAAQWVLDFVGILLERGEGDAALRLARARALAQPGEPEYPNLIGLILLEREDLAGAERAFRQAAQVDPGFVRGYLNLAGMARRAERFEEAHQLYQQALAQRPNDPELLRAFGELEYGRGRTHAAIQAFEAALRADPNSAATSAALARALSDARRDLPRALELARVARTQDPAKADFAEALGRVLHASGLQAAAIAQYRESIALTPHPAAAYHYRLGIALQEDGEPEAAARELREALEIDASFAGADDAQRRLAALGPPAQ